MSRLKAFGAIAMLALLSACAGALGTDVERIRGLEPAGVSPFNAALTREYKELARNQLDAGFMASPVVVGDAFLLRTETHLYRVEAEAQ